MIVYYLVFTIIFIIQLFPAQTDKAYKLKLFFSFLPLFLFGALRDRFGLDFQGYVDFYNNVNRYDNIFLANERMEWGYVVLNRLLPSFRSLIVVTSALTCASYYFLFYKAIPAKYSWLAFVLLFISGDLSVFFMFSGIRNAMSISILIFGILFIKERKILYFGMLVFLASLFHSSALIFMPLAYLIGRNSPITNREYYIWLFALLFLIIFPLGKIIDNFMPFVNLYFDRYDTYMKNAEELGDTRSVLIFFSVTLMTLLLLSFMKKNKAIKLDNTTIRLALLYAFSFILGSMNVRASQYFIPFFIVASTNVYAKWNQKNLKLIYILFVILFLSYSFFVVWQNSEYFSYHEYHSIISL